MFGKTEGSNGPNGYHTNGNGEGSHNGHDGHNGNGAGSQNGHNGHNENGNGAGLRKNIVTSLLGPGIAYHGCLTGEGGIRIDGTFKGEINILGPLVVTDSGKVIAEDIHAGVVSVAGSVRGNITAQQVEILAGGRVWGDVTTVEFASEDGAFLRGRVKMLDEVPVMA